MDRALVLLCILVGCGHPPGPRPSPEPPPASALAARAEATSRLESRLDPGGWVVSWDAGGTAQDVGDSLIWTGIALASVDCTHGQALEQSLLDMLAMTKGGLWRHPSQPSDITLDGAIGFYRGVAARIAKCNRGPTWTKPFETHLDFMTAHHGRLNPSSTVVLPEPWMYVRDLVGYRLGVRAEPDPELKKSLEGTAADWAGLVKEAHQLNVAAGRHVASDACYRVNLGLTALQTVEQLGEPISDAGRNAFCEATDGMDLPTTNYWCGRAGLPDYLGGFQYDLWGYRHQRCAGWEAPDGQGYWQPAVDRLRGLADLYAL